MAADLSGDIQSTPPSQKSLSSRIMTLSLSNISAREWFTKRRESVQPWPEFLNTAKFKTPQAITPAGKRVVRNVEKFQSNYLFVFLGLFIFCILTSPMLIIAIAAGLGACYIVNLKNSENKLKILGKEVPVAQQYAVVGVCCFPLFYLAGAGSAVFWVIGASFFVIMLHALFYNSDDQSDSPFEEIKIEEV